MKKRFAARRAVVDVIAEELIGVLSEDGSFDFKTLFAMIHPKLKARNAVSGGEEMLRLRAYEKLQLLVQQGGAKKTSGLYSGDANGLALVTQQMAASLVKS